MKSYGQFCSLARALDLLGTRWTLLIVRELLCDSRHFGDIQRGIPQISRTMLSARLRELATIVDGYEETQSFVSISGGLPGGILIDAMPASIGVRFRSGSRAGYELVVGTSKFWFRDDPDHLARRLERWCHFWFNEFLPLVPPPGPSSLVAARMRDREARSCPECRQRFLACPGDVGIAVV